MAISAHSTPKRKRGESDTVAPSPLKFSFDSSLAPDSRDGSNSPRSRVAHRFRGLELREGDVAGGSGGGVVSMSTSSAYDEDESDPISKRQRHDEDMPDAEEPPRVVSGLISAQEVATLESTDQDGETVLQPAMPDEQSSEKNPGQNTQQMPELVPDLPDPKALGKKRSGTPPLRVKKLLSKMPDANKDVVDPVRAALTWHEDEITIYDPDDEDDDGTGINGVGFKPTAAIAHARVMKRRQQMAEYKRREESEARARRNQRRKGAPTGRPRSGVSSLPPSGYQGSPAAPTEAESSPRKVRFSEADTPQVAIPTK